MAISGKGAHGAMMPGALPQPDVIEMISIGAADFCNALMRANDMRETPIELHRDLVVAVLADLVRLSKEAP